MASCLLKVTGINGQIELYEDKLRICRRGVLGLLTQGNKGDKDIAISAITAIQLKRAGLLTNGALLEIANRSCFVPWSNSFCPQKLCIRR